jgi:hypothetical protein
MSPQFILQKHSNYDSRNEMPKNMPLQSMSSYSSSRKLNPMSSKITIPKSNKNSTNNLVVYNNDNMNFTHQLNKPNYQPQNIQSPNNTLQGMRS